MKRLVAILLLLLYINSSTEFHEAFRLPVLLEHFAEHRQQAQDMTFWQFLAMHYTTDASHDENDNRLPFKDPCHSYTSVITVLPIDKIILCEISLLSFVDHSSLYRETDVASAPSDIFQPPRVV